MHRPLICSLYISAIGAPTRVRILTTKRERIATSLAEVPGLESPRSLFLKGVNIERWLSWYGTLTASTRRRTIVCCQIQVLRRRSAYVEVTCRTTKPMSSLTRPYSLRTKKIPSPATVGAVGNLLIQPCGEAAHQTQIERKEKDEGTLTFRSNNRTEYST